MIKQYCDRCEKEVLDGVTEGLSELDVLATEDQDSYHFHINAVGLLLCRDCFDTLLMNALGLEMAQPTEAEEESAKMEDDYEKELEEK